MNFLSELAQLQKIIIIIPAVIIVGLALWLTVRYILKRKTFIKEFILALENKTGTLGSFFSMARHPDKIIRSKASLAVKYLNQKPIEYAKKNIVETGLADFWIDRLRKKPVKKYFKYVLDYNIEDGLFICFKYALIKNKYLTYFKNWLDTSKNKLPLRQVARSGGGENFNSAATAVYSSIRSHSTD